MINYDDLIYQVRGLLLRAVEESAGPAGDETDEMAEAAENLTGVLRNLYAARAAAELVDAEVQPAGPGYITLPKTLRVPGVKSDWTPEKLRQYANIYMSDGSQMAGYALFRGLADQIEGQS